MNAVKERPILFTGAMVRALLAGTKTQTRRALKPQPSSVIERLFIWKDNATPDDELVKLCPHGSPGDQLWVRETTRSYYAPNPLTGEPTSALCGQYVADEEPVQNEDGFDFVWWYSRKTCPTIHMPRWASRIQLEVTGVRVERLWDISAADVLAEGCEGYVLTYAKLWESINGPGSWDANPWVFVIEFKRIKP